MAVFLVLCPGRIKGRHPGGIWRACLPVAAPAADSRHTHRPLECTCASMVDWVLASSSERLDRLCGKAADSIVQEPWNSSCRVFLHVSVPAPFV